MGACVTPQDIQRLRTLLPTMTEVQKRRTLDLLAQYQKQHRQKRAQTEFLEFCKAVYPNYIVGPHHRKLAALVEAVAEGREHRVTVSIAPRMGKSEMISYLAPAWYLGRFPAKKIIIASHTADLAIDFGRKVRNLVGSEAYHEIFPAVELSQDSKSAGRWSTNFGGEFYAVGVGGALAGRGGDFIVIDDAHSEQEAKQGRPEVFAHAYEWFQSGPLQRLMPNGAIIIVGTRWNKADLIGKVIDHSIRNPDSDPWTVVEFPAILCNEKTGEESSLWPEFWPLDQLLAKKAGLDSRYWQAQYMQDPTSEEGALIKREWWRCWEPEDPPACEFTIMALDAAQETNNRADYNSLTLWGVFYNEEEKMFQIILLNAVRERLEFPDLKARVLEEYNEWRPDSFIVEKKSNGAALYQEMRRMGIGISEFTPGKGNDKISRVNSVSDLFQSGIVWAPDRRWSRELIEECASFPSGEYDDQVDSMTLALMRFRQGGYVRVDSDEDEPRPVFKGRSAYKGYYNVL